MASIYVPPPAAPPLILAWCKGAARSPSLARPRANTHLCALAELIFLAGEHSQRCDDTNSCTDTPTNTRTTTIATTCGCHFGLGLHAKFND